jgi:transcriptional regulator with XRE-family HTH domain
MEINDRIKLILKEQGVTDKKLAQWIGISTGRISQKFKDEVWDSLAELKKISEHTGYRLDWIVTGKGAKKEEPEMAGANEPPIKKMETDPLQKEIISLNRTIAAMEKTIAMQEKLNLELSHQLDECRSEKAHAKKH